MYGTYYHRSTEALIVAQEALQGHGYLGIAYLYPGVILKIMVESICFAQAVLYSCDSLMSTCNLHFSMCCSPFIK